MRKLLYFLSSKITGKDRYQPDFCWSEKSIVYNFFRIYEFLFGRAYGKKGIGDTIRPESSTIFIGENGSGKIVSRSFYTYEALFVYIESCLYDFFKFPKINWKFVKVPQLSIASVDTINIGIPIYSFAVAYDASSIGVQGEYTFNHTVTGSNPAIIGAVGISYQDYITGMSYNGDALTAKNKVNVTGTTYGYTYALAGCDTGTNQMLISKSAVANLLGGAISYSGVDSIGNTVGQADAQTDFSSTVNVGVTNSYVVLIITGDGYGGTCTAGSNATVRNNSAGGHLSFFDSNAAVSTGNYTQTATGNVSGKYNASFQICLSPYIPSGPVNMKTYNGLAKASVSKIEGLAIGSSSKINGLA